jgi:hypothetical protein
MNIIVRLFIIIVIIIFVMSNVVKQYRHYSSSFWKTQPVMHFSFFNNHRWKAQQKISNKLPKAKVLPSHSIKMQLEDVQSENYSLEKLEGIVNLINNFYMEVGGFKYSYTPEFYRWLTYKDVVLTIKDDDNTTNTHNNTIATMNAKPINLSINNTELQKCMYVDNLCIDTKYRKQGLIENLITSMLIVTGKQADSEELISFIYKKEHTPLPYEHITKYSNYYIAISERLGDLIKPVFTSYKLMKVTTTISLELKQSVYEYYMTNQRMHTSYTNMESFKDFNHKFIDSEYVKTYIFYDETQNTSIDGFFSILDSHYSIDLSTFDTFSSTKYFEHREDQDLKVCELLVFNSTNHLTFNPEIVDNRANEMLKQIREFDLLLISDLSETNQLLLNRIEQKVQIADTYLHMYNYSVPNILPNDKTSLLLM